jgi:hypothetical protein
MTSLGITLADPVDVSHIRDITWSVSMGDGTGRSNLGCFEATGGPGTNSDTAYSSAIFESFDLAIDELTGLAATATATMRPVGVPAVVARGSGYSTGQTLLLLGGTFSSQASVIVSLLSTVAGQDETNYGGAEFFGTFTPGTGYNISDTITLSDGTVVTVDAVGTAGDVTQFTVTSASTSGNGNLATLSQSSTSGGGSSFSLTQSVNNQGVFAGSYTQAAEVPVGEYTALPTDPVATSGSGSGATFNVDWGVRAVTVTAGGQGYEAAPAVSFGGAGGVGTTAVAVLTGDAVTAVTVAAPGSGYTARATVSIAGP